MPNHIVRSRVLSMLKRFSIMLCMITFAFNASVAQVIIRDTIRIAPKLRRAISSNSTLTVNFSYSGTILSHNPNNPPQTYNNTFRIVNNFTCHVDQSVDVTGGSGSLSVQGSGGGYEVSVGLHVPSNGVSTIDVLLDGQNVGHIVDSVTCSSQCTVLLDHIVTLYSDLNFSASSGYIDFNNPGTLHLQSVMALCQSNVFVPSVDSITVTITSGNQYAVLQAPSGSTGSSVQVIANELAEVTLSTLCTVPHADTVSVTVEASVAGITKQLAVLVGPQFPLDHLQLQMATSMGTDDSTGITIRELDVNGDEVDCDDDRQITISMDSLQYGLFRLLGDTVRASVTRRYADLRNGQLKFWAQGVIPDSTIEIHFQASTSGIATVTDSIALVPPPDCITVTACPSEISPGDTTNLIVHRTHANGNVVPFGPDQRFYIDFWNWPQDTVYGKFLQVDTPGRMDYLDCALQGFKFIASSDTLAPAGYQIRFYAYPEPSEWCSSSPEAAHVRIDDERGNIVQHHQPSRDEIRAMITGSKLSKKNTRTVSEEMCELGGVSEKVFSILLGETKYLVAKVCQETNSLTIDTTADGGHSHERGDGVEFDWGAQPVDAVLESKKPTSDRIGVYWETLKPNPDGTGNLSAGILRIVGRYWRSDSIYKVRITAHYGEYNPASIVVEVKRPQRLGTTYQMAYDIAGQDLNIDSVIIYYAGRYGVPPQYLKGQMFVESWKSGTGRFWPSYRYEPFTDIYFSRQPILAYRQSYKDHPFWVDANGMDPNDVPSNHQNVMPIYYPVSPMTIGNYLADNLDQYTVGTGKKRSLVGLKEVNDNSTWYAYTSMLRILVRYYMDQLDYSQQVAQDSADEWMETYFKDIYGGIWAQTRKAASYGFSQMLYTTALGRHYPRSYTSLPEILNQQDTLLPLVNRFLVEKATIILDGVSFDQSQWNSGLEAVWLRTFKMYNRGKASYAPEVIQRTALFPPLE